MPRCGPRWVGTRPDAPGRAGETSDGRGRSDGYRRRVKTSTPSVRRAVIASAAVLTGLVVAAAVLFSEGRTDDGPDAPTVAAPPVPEPVEEAPPPPAPVRGEVEEVSLRDLSVTGSGLRTGGSDTARAVPVDQAAVDAAVDAATTFVDDHLTSAHDGEGGQLPEGLEGPRDAVTRGLASPDLPAVGAGHKVAVGVLGTPEWVSVGSVVERADGSTAAATFVFTVLDGELTLIAVQAGAGAEAPPPDEDGDGDDPDGPREDDPADGAEGAGDDEVDA